MNARANALGLGAVLSVAVGLCILLITDHPSPWLGGAIGLGCAGLYIIGLEVGRADGRSR